jgi:hypothetical protein
MDRTARQRNARDVRDQLEQALYSLPRLGVYESGLALQIEEAIELAMELEHLRVPPEIQAVSAGPNDGLRKMLRPRQKPRAARIWT